MTRSFDLPMNGASRLRIRSEIDPPFPVVVNERAMGRRKRLKATKQIIREGLAERLPRDRLNHRQSILSPMQELRPQQFLLLFCGLELGDIARSVLGKFSAPRL
jgi:hypothetical protein